MATHCLESDDGLLKIKYCDIKHSVSLYLKRKNNTWLKSNFDACTIAALIKGKYLLVRLVQSLDEKNSKGLYNFYSARKEVRNLNIKSVKEYRSKYRLGKIPNGIPINPQTIYQELWLGWDNWLGISTDSDDAISIYDKVLIIKEKFNGTVYFTNNHSTEWYKDGKLHRDDGPSEVLDNCDRKWFSYHKDGVLHRSNGPARVTSGSVQYFVNGKFHRVDGPAVTYTSGDKFWYLDGEFHRTDGPAAECSKGDLTYYINGKRHRIDGPALIRDNGNIKKWYLEGRLLPEEEFIMRTSRKGALYYG